MPPLGILQYKYITVVIARNCPIKDPHMVAAFLSDVLPNVTAIVSGGVTDVSDSPEEALEYHKRWHKVQSLIRVITKVRQQERMGR